MPGEGSWTVEIGADREPPTQRYPVARLSVVTRSICGGCHGVLNGLEAWARSNLGPMMAGTSEGIRAQSRAQRYAATWAVKTMLMCDLVLPPCLLDQHFREAFFARRAPLESTLVWWAGYDGPSPGYRLVRRRLIAPDPAPVVPRASVYASLRLGHLVFIAVMNVSGRSVHLSRTRVTDEALGQIWPAIPGGGAWPPNQLVLTDEGFEAHAQEDFVVLAEDPLS